MDTQRLIAELQAQGLNMINPELAATGRRGGAGPSDHKAVTIAGMTVMVPIYTHSAAQSPYSATIDPVTHEAVLYRDRVELGVVQFPQQPRFYGLTTPDGIPYWKIALLHSRDVLATTVLQTCMRYDSEASCQFCAIGQSLAANRTIARKLPAQLAEVAAAAVRLDGVKQLVMTTGTPNTPDRGAAHLADCAAAVKRRVDLPIQAQCEPPSDYQWFAKLKAAGVDSLGMHLEAVEPEVRSAILPGKATVSLETYFEAFAAAVPVFGWGQVSTYILAGLGDRPSAIVETCDRLIQLGVYPFVVPFVPISGTPMQHHAPPSSEMMVSLYQQIAALLDRSGMSSQAMKAGCAKCGACSALSAFESRQPQLVGSGSDRYSPP